MGNLSLPHLIIIAMVIVIWMIPASMILKKAGLSRWWALACLFPPFSPFLFWGIALARWPDQRNTSAFN